MKEYPILFNGEMVRAILSGRKTQTRRVMKPQPPAGNYRYDGVGDVEKDEDADHECHWLEVLDEYGEYAERYWNAGKCPYGVIGDRLWVRETWAYIPDTTPGNLHYKASSTSADLQWFLEDNWKWRPSIHMPRNASRITLEVTGVRLERLQDISDEDAKAEGVWSDEMYADRVGDGEIREIHCPQCHGEGVFMACCISGASEADCDLCDTAVKRFRLLWDSIAKPGAKWADNPWAWVIEFRRVE